MKKETDMKTMTFIKRLSLLGLLFIISAIAWADDCSYCGYNNGSERYCANCFQEVRPITAEEKQELDKYDSIRTSKAKEHYANKSNNQSIRHHTRNSMPAKNIGFSYFVLIIAAALISFVCSIVVLVRAFQTSLTWGLCSLFIPFAILVFTVKYWDEVKTPTIVGFLSATSVWGFKFLFI